MTANAASCAGMTSVHTSFDPPALWDGACTADNAIPANKQCGAQPCVQSLTIAPLTINEAGCAASQLAPSVSPAIWTTYALGCKDSTNFPCSGGKGLCVGWPDPPPAGFRECIVAKGDVECPAGDKHSEKRVSYDEKIDDTRGCTPCTCGAPTGTSCSALVSTF